MFCRFFRPKNDSRIKVLRSRPFKRPPATPVDRKSAFAPHNFWYSSAKIISIRLDRIDFERNLRSFLLFLVEAVETNFQVSLEQYLSKCLTRSARFSGKLTNEF